MCIETKVYINGVYFLWESYSFFFSNVDAETWYSSIWSSQQEQHRSIIDDSFSEAIQLKLLSSYQYLPFISNQNGESFADIYVCYHAVTNASQASTTAKVTDWVHPGDKSGEFKRQVSSFRDSVSRSPGAQYPPEKGRYHLYVSYACPWAHRTLIARKLKGLEDIVSFSVVHWHLAQGGWRFVTPEDTEIPGEGVVPDPIEGHEAFKRLSDVYFESEKDFDGRYTVPVLYDKKTKRIVSNESSEILRMFGTEASLLDPVVSPDESSAN